MVKWFYESIYNAIADFFTLMGDMGADIFDLAWMQSTVRLFGLLGWILFIVGTVVAIFDLAIESQNGGGNIKSTCLHILMGFMACSMLETVPISLYKFCITLQNTFAHDLTHIFIGSQSSGLATLSLAALVAQFSVLGNTVLSPLYIILMIAFAYCVIKVFFQNIKRGGILVVQVAVGSLYMFCVPRGHTDGFFQWLRQVIALCLTSFLQTTLLYLGLMTFGNNMLLGLGIMLTANEVPKIAQQFGLDTTVRFNMTSVVHTASTAMSVGRMLSSFK